jgi:1,4-dihydroxy-2-naphthoate octaprenyltransferase
MDKEDAIEREDKKQMDQLVRKQKDVISATTVQPKVITIFTFILF